MKTKILFLFIFFVVTLKSQILTWEPVYFTEDSAVTITFDATKGNAGLAGFSGTVYAHTGVLLANSSSNSDWYAAPQWLNNDDRYKLTKIGDDLYQFVISPSVFDYYSNAPSEKPIDASDEITHLAFVFRNADGTREGKGDGNSDLFIELRTGVNIVVPSERPYKAELNEVFPVTAVGSSITDTLKLYVGEELIHTTTADTITANITADTYKEWIKVVGTTDFEINVVDSFYYYVNPEVVVEDPPADVIDGINYHDDDRTTTLVLYAANKDYVYVIGDFTKWEIDPNYHMKRSTDGARYWLTVEDLNVGQEYAFQYFVDGEIKIADPYTEKVLDPWNDSFIPESVYPDLKPYPSSKTDGIVSVLQTAKQNFDWEVENFDRPSKEKLVIYELLD
ncbi:MAG: hypothetical protein U5K00_10560 [Melioribacteraceae bacterium]|nr:hypothetical protein [Melioribacteraceae bacterium]